MSSKVKEKEQEEDGRRRRREVYCVFSSHTIFTYSTSKLKYNKFYTSSSHLVETPISEKGAPYKTQKSTVPAFTVEFKQPTFSLLCGSLVIMKTKHDVIDILFPS